MTPKGLSKELAKLVPTTKEIADVLRNAGIKDVRKEKSIHFYLCKRSDESSLVAVYTLEDVNKLYEQGYIFEGMRFRTGKDMRNRAYMCGMSVKQAAKGLRSHPKK
jgi:hypothetical protein